MAKEENKHGRPKQKLAILSGPTASGKSRLAIEAAKSLEERGIGAEIISADSAQVYRHMDIGTDKLQEDDWLGVKHNLIDVADPDEDFSAADFRTLARETIGRLESEGKVAVVVGGTGFYLRALIQGLFKGPPKDEKLRESLRLKADKEGPWSLHERVKSIDPESAARIHPNDVKRLVRAIEVYELTGKTMSQHFSEHDKSSEYDILLLGLDLARPILYERINARVDEMMRKGFLEEVKELRSRGYGPGLKSQQILGYRQMHSHLDGRITLEEAVSDAKTKTRNYARRQLVWMRSERKTIWLNPETEKEKIMDKIISFFEN